jgi:hypothetical protein
LNPITVFRLINLFFAGILAGMEIAIPYGLHAPTKILSDQSQLQFRQALVRRLRVLVPAFFLLAALSGMAVAVLDGIAPGFWFRCAAILAVLVWVLIRVIGTVPINAATVAWDSGSRPENWKAQNRSCRALSCFGGPLAMEIRTAYCRVPITPSNGVDVE